MKRIAIVGGGIAGLSAAFRAEQLRRAGSLEYVLFEQSPRWGGVIQTEIVDGCIVEAGPDSFLTGKPAAAALCREIGLGEHLITSKDSQRKTRILVDGRLVPLPDGLQFMVPTRIAPILLSPLFSLGTKLRFAREWLAKPSAATSNDESVADFVRRHFGNEVVDRLADPLLSGIYGGDAARLSSRAVLPQMVDMEAQHGSLTRAVLAARKQRSAKTGSPPPLFTSLRGGMQQMVDSLVAQLDANSIRPNTSVSGLERSDGHWLVASSKGGGKRLEPFDGIVLALPAYVAATLLRETAAELARTLDEIAYSSSITVALGYQAASVRNVPMDGFGFLVPRSQGKRILACTFVHQKFPYRAPEERALLRCFIGGQNAESAFDRTDAEILAAVRSDIRDILGLATDPLFTRVYRWKRAMAQYEVGHLDRIERIERLRRQLPGVTLAGNAYRGIGIPDCISSGAAALAELAGAIEGASIQKQDPAVRV